MTVLVHASKTYLGLSTDDKPSLTAKDVGSIFREADTNLAYIWTGIEWLRMTAKEDLRRALTDGYWKDRRFDWSGVNPIYKGFNIEISEDDDPTWGIWKYTYDGEDNITKIQGPLVGAWNNRENLGW